MPLSPKLTYKGKLSVKCSLILSKNSQSMWIIVLSSQTNFLLMETTFPHYLGLKHCKRSKIEKIYEFLLLVKGVQSFST